MALAVSSPGALDSTAAGQLACGMVRGPTVLPGALMRRVVSILLAAASLGACAGRGHPTPAAAVAAATAAGSPTGTLAQVYYWRAKPGKLDEYSRYIREVAEPGGRHERDPAAHHDARLIGYGQA